MVESLLELEVELLAASVGARHYHLLGRFPTDRVREFVGRAKRRASFKLDIGGVWAVRCRAKPIRDRAHQINVFYYILEHAQEGAWVWSFREGMYWRKAQG